MTDTHLFSALKEGRAMLTAAVEANFSPRPDQIMEFDRSTYLGKWRRTAKCCGR